jgi:hypothetical protein
MLAGNKNYLPTKVSRSLKTGGLGRLLFKNTVSRQQALKAITYLQKNKTISRLKPPSQLFRQAQIKEQKQKQAALATEKQKHIRANIAIDIGEELAAEAKSGDPIRYDPRSVLGKSLKDEIDQKQAVRDKKVAGEKERRQQLYQPKGIKPPKPELADTDKLVDLDIG